MAPYPIQRIIGDVENFGMPHFFLILTFDETSSLRWKKIEDIENLATFFQ
jgi:hypothetical protein